MKDKHDVTYRWILKKKKKDTSDVTKQKQTHRLKNQTYGYKGETMGVEG